MPDLSVTVNGLKLPNPFVIGSGPPGTNANVIGKAFDEGWGAVIAKTISLEAEKVINVQPRYARLIGMPRSYGYGATMGAWILDYLANWGGEHSFCIHSNFKYTGPAHTGDATFLDGEVTEINHDRETGQPIATVKVKMTTQTGNLMATGSAEVLLPAA